MKNLYRVAFLIWGTILLASCTSKTKTKPTLEAKLQEVIDSIYTNNKDALGIMVHVESPKNKLSFSYAKGYSDKVDSTLIEADQPILIASCTKTYVSASILKLIEQGKLNLNDPISGLINPKTEELLISDNYKPKEIKVKHLLSHTSGINNYGTKEYFEFCYNNPTHRWTRDEQLEFLVENLDPVGEAEDKSTYSDANYLLLTEIIENIYKADYNVAIKELINYPKLGLKKTWFHTIDPTPPNIKAFIHQYYSKYDWDSHNIDISWDLYGGGGIATTTEELAKFYQALFTNEIVTDTKVFQQIYTKVETRDSIPQNYYMGISERNYAGKTAYGHDGFWGVTVCYFPESETSVAIVVSEFNRHKLRAKIFESLSRVIHQ